MDSTEKKAKLWRTATGEIEVTRNEGYRLARYSSLDRYYYLDNKGDWNGGNYVGNSSRRRLERIFKTIESARKYAAKHFPDRKLYVHHYEVHKWFSDEKDALEWANDKKYASCVEVIFETPEGEE